MVPWGILAAFKCREAEPEQCLNMSVCCRVYISALALASEEKGLSKNASRCVPLLAPVLSPWETTCASSGVTSLQVTAPA